ncbi:cysteine desulfurase [Pseudomonas sp. R5(2019)]|uniref:cysteine desulfurase n=1 Tax=Pseudomonas sp. R5(2019) TaxID=2697566 RepID=UPI001411F8BE|nr:cysteine desulfurase [Pseudomonas sp. R5(2019)]NBA93522.1 SufS family cysteine desulfurase [Pseudomonas sp. R5(2019)]
MSNLETSLQTPPKRLDLTASYDVERVRQAFPILAETVYGKPLIYLDSAATSQKPQAVIDAMSRFFLKENANVHRGVHYLSVRATEEYEKARAKVQRFLNAEHVEEIVFVRGTTEAVNLVAQTLGKTQVHAGDEVLISAMEHHSNIVPWQMLCEQTGAHLRVAPIDDAGELLLDELERLIGPRTRLVAVAHVSNVLGTINPIQRIVELAHARGARVLVDGAQAAPHLRLDVRALGCDFYALSGHKMYGPTGVGVLYGRRELLEAMPPYQGGGDMILSVSFEKTLYNKPPYRFEAGTPNMAGAIGLGAAIDFLGELGAEAIAAHEQAVLSYAQQALAAVPGLRLIGTAPEKVGVLSFVLDGIHPHDIGTVLDREGIAIRTGHHCAQPLMQRFGLAATARASLGCYSTEQDIDALVAGLAKVRELFQ